MITDLKENGARTDGASDDTNSTSGSESDDEYPSDSASIAIEETPYCENELDVKSTSGPLAEEFADENKNIIWCLMKQVFVIHIPWMEVMTMHVKCAKYM